MFTMGIHQNTASRCDQPHIKRRELLYAGQNDGSVTLEAMLKQWNSPVIMLCYTMTEQREYVWNRYQQEPNHQNTAMKINPK